jgi:alpha-ketoglutarate-dependent taurine dioxygenase
MDAMTDGPTFAATELTPLVGTEVKADAESLANGRYAMKLRALLEQRGVLIFRDVHLTDAQQLAFSESLGEVVRRGESAIQPITLDINVSSAAEYLKGSFYWHIDGACEGVPNLAALLGARNLSPTGGETQFANTYAAWDELPEQEKQSLEKLRVIHSLEATQRMVYPQPTYAQVESWQQFGKKNQPLVWTHRSGRKSLVLGSSASHIEGMDFEEGRMLLCKLLDWATQPRFVYTHEWKLGDLLMWDNTGTMHRVLPYAADSGRLMHRTTLAGEEALA